MAERRCAHAKVGHVEDPDGTADEQPQSVPRQPEVMRDKGEDDQPARDADEPDGVRGQHVPDEWRHGPLTHALDRGGEPGASAVPTRAPGDGLRPASRLLWLLRQPGHDSMTS